MKKIPLLLQIFSMLFTGVYASDFSVLTITTPYVTSTIDDGICVKNGQTFLDFARTREASGRIQYYVNQSKNIAFLFLILTYLTNQI